MRDELSVLSAFLAVADERSFTKAAKRLNISTSGLSHAIRRLEEQIGVRLLTRTTRSVSPTDAGEQLLAQLRPALSDIRGVLTSLTGLQSTPVGRIRLLCPRLAAKTVVGPKLGQFVRDYPAVELEITTDDSRLDLCPPATTRAFSSGNTLRRTWWLFVCRRTSGRPSLRHRPTSSHIPSRQLPETC